MAIKREIVASRKLVASAGTAESIVADDTWVKKVSIKALSTNVGIVYVGDSAVDNTNGYELAAGVELALTDLLPDDDSNFKLNEVYIDAANNNDGVAFVYWA